jgi:branched-subunit amino acid transport protein
MRTHLLLLIVGMGIVTYLTRAPCFLACSRRELPAQVQRWLRHVPVALLAALLVPTLLMPKGTLWSAATIPYLLGTAVTVLTLSWTKNVLAIVAASVATVALCRLLLGP